MSNWYRKHIKESWNRGVPLMDEYSGGDRPSSSNYKKDPRSLVNAKPEFGGHKRDGYPKNISREEDTSDFEDIRGHIPGENVLMDQDPPTGEGANDERFVDELDKMPIKRKPDPIGPHNMQNRLRRNIFDLVSKKTRGF